MTLPEYLGTPQAREDVRSLVERWSVHHGTTQGHVGTSGQILHASQAGVWTRIELATGQEWRPMAYFRPEGGRFVVTDLGEGVRELRLRTGMNPRLAMHEASLIAPADVQKYPHLGWFSVVGSVELLAVSEANLPDALCRVMLASINVAGVRV